uniref:NADH-ubiquinone oxidoreductase chain 2 n=1 Tax=Amphigerontia montivaga TaxID=2051644 RepID=A0A343QCD5_9NEOP|nr:NADH dehydrogenase subunit 2 [Amphigerontia montivaga]ATU07082.1 NADH dehydrogenase subunit 2 [Amphigerontia montivaga]
MLNNLNILFFFMMILSTLLSVSSTNWLGTWMGLEVNMMSFIPMILVNKNILSNEASLKYFLIQAIASCSFITFCLMNSIYTNFFSSMQMTMLVNLLVILPLMMKMGAAPFQAWFIVTMEGLNWMKCFILMTWQKVAPMFILMYISLPKIIIPFSILSLMAGALGGLNQTSLKKIMAYSSVNHLGWMMTGMMMNKFMLIFYFSAYIMLNYFTLTNLMKLNKMNFNQIFSKPDFYLAVSLLSLSGLPPFLGFLPKWMIINWTINNNMYMLSVIMIITALITIFFYMRMILNSIIMSNYTQKWVLSNYSTYSFMNNIMLMLTMTGMLLFNFMI